MGMTNEGRAARYQIQNLLKHDGYPLYAKLLNLYDLHLTSIPSITAYHEPKKGRIVINRKFDEKCVSVVIRHELLHAFLNHHERMLRHIAKNMNLDFDKLDDLSIRKLERIAYNPNSVFNIVADYEISNRAYTEEDKRIIRKLVLNNRTLKGLVTEDKHPEWASMSLEEMWDEAQKLRKEYLDNLQKELDNENNQDDSQYGDSNQGGGQDENQDNNQKPQRKKPQQKKKGVERPEFIDGSVSSDKKVFVDENGVEYGF